jgi:hypothetical protein
LVGGPVGRSIGNKETVLREREDRRISQLLRLREKRAKFNVNLRRENLMVGNSFLAL